MALALEDAAHHGVDKIAFKSERCGLKASEGSMWLMSPVEVAIFITVASSAVALLA